jgi:hypothetical protein
LLCNQVRTKKAHQATVRVSRQHSLHCLGKTTQPLRPPGLSAPERLDSIVSALVPWVPTLGESEGTMESATVMQAKANLDQAVRHQTSKPVSGAAVMRAKIRNFQVIVQNTDISAEAEWLLSRLGHARNDEPCVRPQ